MLLEVAQVPLASADTLAVVGGPAGLMVALIQVLKRIGNWDAAGALIISFVVALVFSVSATLAALYGGTSAVVVETVNTALANWLYATGIYKVARSDWMPGPTEPRSPKDTE